MSEPSTRPGRLVAGRYRVLSQIGGGGMGTVWMAQDELLGRRIAIKQVLPPAGTDPAEGEQQRQRALREGRIAARLSHPHAISVYDVALEHGQPWLVMEYLPSRSLAAVLAEDGVLKAEQVAQIGAQVADALAATHAAGIVHRDVKPANILIGEGDKVEGLVKITDFGISHASGDVTLTQTGQITGTPAFLSPEVAQGEEPTPASDVFSLGATLYTCMEGIPPFGMGDNALQQLHRVAQGLINPPRRCGRLTGPLMRMLEADPAARPSMTEVRDDLAALAARDGDTTTVLMARTNLRSTSPGRQRTATWMPPVPTPIPVPVPVPEPEPVHQPTPAPADGPPATTPAPAAPPPPSAVPTHQVRRRRTAVWAAVGALVVAALVAGGILLAGSGDDPGGATAGGTSTAAGSTSGSSATAAGTSSSGSTSADSTTDGSAADGSTTDASSPAGSSTAGSSAGGDSAVGAPTAAEVRTAITSYYALLPGDAESAWARTGPRLRAAESHDNYIRFWNRFSSVTLGAVSATDGSLTATAQVTYVENGVRSPEQHTFTLTRGTDGGLLIDSDVPG